MASWQQLCPMVADWVSLPRVMLLSPYADEVAQVIVQEKVPVVTTGAGDPSKYMKLWLEAGCKVIAVVPSVAMAKLVTRLGASAMIAAGGIADGRAVAAAFMLGACGVQVGTRFLAAEECSIHPVYKEKILGANDLCTMVTGKRLGHPVRSLRTQFARNYAKAEYGGMPDEELESLGVSDPLRGKAIKAYVVASAGYAPDKELEKELRDFSNARMAEYKWIRIIEFVEAIPKTISGKICKAALRR